MRTETLRTIRLADRNVRLMAAILAEAEFDLEASFAEAGLPVDLLDGVPTVVSGQQDLAFQAAFGRATRLRPDLWVTLGQRYCVSTMGTLGLALMTAPTLHPQFPESDHLHYSLAEVSHSRSGNGYSKAVWDLTKVPSELHAFVILRDFTSASKIMSELLGERIPFESVRLGIKHPGREIAEQLGYDIAFGTGPTEITISDRVLSRRLKHSDEFHFRLHLAECRQLVERADQFMFSVRAAMREGSSNMGDISRKMHLSTRTFQRKLDERGINFRRLIDIHRKQQAIDLLTYTGLTVSEIALRSGYGDLTSFNHAFKRWTGLTPRSLRKGRHD